MTSQQREAYKARQISDLEATKAELVADLQRTANLPHVDAQWRGDRMRELAYVNRTLVRLGAAPAHIVVA